MSLAQIQNDEPFVVLVFLYSKKTYLFTYLMNCFALLGHKMLQIDVLVLFSLPTHGEKFMINTILLKSNKVMKKTLGILFVKTQYSYVKNGRSTNGRKKTAVHFKKFLKEILYIAIVYKKRGE